MPDEVFLFVFNIEFPVLNKKNWLEMVLTLSIYFLVSDEKLGRNFIVSWEPISEKPSSVLSFSG